MSRKIDMTKQGSWDEDDVLYLRDRGMLPSGFNMPKKGLDPGAPEDGPAIGDVGMADEVISEEEMLDDYDEMRVSELKSELSARDLSSEGNKAELISRLREDDATRI